MRKKTIAITGCSSGFGRLTALALAQRGWHVFATVRKETDKVDLQAEVERAGIESSLTVLLCDITLAEQVAMFKSQVEDMLRSEMANGATPELDVLLNNAGTAFGGPIELLELDDLRDQFEVNVIAQVAVTQAFLPLLKAAKGTIINVSSVSGLVASPIVGAYAASKFALEAISDALRIELAPFAVRVVLIEPTSSPTHIWQTSLDRALTRLKQYRGGDYERLLSITEKVAKRSSVSGFPSQLFVDTVVEVLNARQPRARYIVPRSARRQVLLRRILPDGLWDRLVRRTLKW